MTNHGNPFTTHFSHFETLASFPAIPRQIRWNLPMLRSDTDASKWFPAPLRYEPLSASSLHGLTDGGRATDGLPARLISPSPAPPSLPRAVDAVARSVARDGNDDNIPRRSTASSDASVDDLRSQLQARDEQLVDMQDKFEDDLARMRTALRQKDLELRGWVCRRDAAV